MAGGKVPAPARNDPATVRRLTAENRGLIGMVVRRYPHLRGIERDDLRQVGALGLVRAAELFDPSRGAFSTIAVPWIRQAISRWIKYQCRWLARHEQLPDFGELLTDRTQGPAERCEARDEVTAYLDRLSASYREAVIMQFGIEGM